MLITRNAWLKRCRQKTTSRRCLRTTRIRRRIHTMTPVVSCETLEMRTLLTATTLLEPNDVVGNAAPADVNPGDRFYFDSATIGDSPSVGLDVDLYRVELVAGDHLAIDIDTPSGQFEFDSLLRVFDAAGIERAISDDSPSPGEMPSQDSWIDFVAPHTGTFFVGVSGFGNFGAHRVSRG